MKTLKKFKALLLMMILSSAFVACSSDDDNPTPVNETEMITDVSLIFTDSEGAETTYTYTDPQYRDNSYVEPIIDMQAGKTYAVSAHFYDKSNPDDIEDITEEVIEEKNDHFLEYRFENVSVDLERMDGAETTDNQDIQIGLFTNWMGENSGTGNVQVTLIHQPESKDTSNPFGNHTGGETDAQVNFALQITE